MFIIVLPDLESFWLQHEFAYSNNFNNVTDRVKIPKNGKVDTHFFFKTLKYAFFCANFFKQNKQTTHSIFSQKCGPPMPIKVLKNGRFVANLLSC